MQHDILVNAARVNDELETLSTFSETPSPAITRIAFSAPDMSARRWLKQLCVNAGLTVREDAAGNMFARWHGSDPNARPIATGSHVDAIPNSGRYDGTVGVLGGLEAIRALKDSGFKPVRSLELVLFTSEEPTRFGIGCLGSRLLSGALSPEAAALLEDKEKATFNQVRRGAGFHSELTEVRLLRPYYHAFIELHIEQGPRLEQQGIAIGVVTSIAAPSSLRVTVRGQGGHAGTVLMSDRQDALLGASEIALSAEAVGLSTGSKDSVCTTGICEVFPGAVNSIPSLVRLELDVRDTELNRRDEMVHVITESCTEIARKRRLQVTVEVLNADAPAQCHPMIVEAIANACRTTHKSFTRLVSRAYHDSLFMSRIAPAGMIFIPCKSGISHHPEEFASPEDIASGVAVLAQALAELSEVRFSKEFCESTQPR